MLRKLGVLIATTTTWIQHLIDRKIRRANRTCPTAKSAMVCSNRTSVIGAACFCQTSGMPSTVLGNITVKTRLSRMTHDCTVRWWSDTELCAHRDLPRNVTGSSCWCHEQHFCDQGGSPLQHNLDVVVSAKSVIRAACLCRPRDEGHVLATSGNPCRRCSCLRTSVSSKEALQDRFLGRRPSEPSSGPGLGGNRELATRGKPKKLARQTRAERRQQALEEHDGTFHRLVET